MNRQNVKNGFPVVSIVIPAFNHAQYLVEAVNSVLAQDYPNLELIVINDGSDDNTAEVLSELEGEFYWETQSNVGQSRTLTKGWEMAKGEILSYLSADDILEPRAVSAAVSALIKSPKAVATYCDFKLIDPLSRLIRKVNATDFNYEKMLTDVTCPVGPGAFFRRSAYLQSGPWNPAYKQMPDYDFWLRLGLHGHFIRLAEVLAGFRVHEGSQTYSITTPDRASEPVTIVTNILKNSTINALDEDLQARALACANLVSGQLHLRAGRFKSATINIHRAYDLYPITLFAPRTLKLLFNAIMNRAGHQLLWQVRNQIKRKKP